MKFVSIIVHFLLFGLSQHIIFVTSEDDSKTGTKPNEKEVRRNYTPYDLIQNLAILAEEELQPRLRFPSRDEENDPFYQSNLNSDEIQLNSQQNYPQQYQPNYQHQNLGIQNHFGQGASVEGNGIYDNFNQNQQNYQNQDLQYNQPQNFRRPKKPKQNRYRPQIPISNDPLDPYYQNYPPYAPYYQQQHRPGFPPNNGQGYYPGFGLNQGQNQQFYPGQNFGHNPYYDDQGAFGSLMNALNSIAKNDDQQCVPRLLCEVAAGGNPSYRQASFLPSFLNTESLFTLISALTGSVSPLLVFGRAALLGVNAQGRPQSCRYAYPECPRDPDRLVEYLNNHNGGFFRFFNGLNGQQGLQNLPGFNGQQALQNILGFNGQQDFQNLPGQNGLINNNQQRPLNQNLLNLLTQQLRPLLNNGGQNGNYLNTRPINYPNQLNNYQNGLQNQRPYYDSLYNYRNDNGDYRRYPVIHDYQTRTNNKTGGSGKNEEIDAEARILNNHLQSINNDDQLRFVSYQTYKIPDVNDQYVSLSYQNNQFVHNGKSEIKFPTTTNLDTNFIPNDNSFNFKSTLKFPGDSTNGGENIYNNVRNPKSINFPNSQYNNDLYYPKPLPFYDHSKMIFPDRTGTGNLKFDSDKLQSNYRPDIVNGNYYNLNQNRPYYQSNSQFSYGQHDYYRGEPTKKKYIYIVRGNGDPNHPEIIEDPQGREARDITISDDKRIDAIRDKNLFTFPSSYQGVVYND